MPLIEHTQKGLFCAQAGVYIDPWRKVDNALITHGHSDHARWGHKYYVCAASSVNILKHRLGHDINVRGLPFGETLTVNGVHFSFHPAGHITGSAQIRVEHNGEIWVITGDYKVEDDGLCTPFEPIKCQHFITECTFGLPVYRWQSQIEIVNQIKDWWTSNADQKTTSVITAYSLGKAQRLIHALGDDIGPILTHSAVEKMNDVFRESGISLPHTQLYSEKIDKKILERALIVTPSSGLSGKWLQKVRNYSLANASGWMAVRGNRRRFGADRGFVLSDHCDWDGLLSAIEATGATHIYPTHGNTVSFSKYLNEQGYSARPIETEYGEAEDDDGATLPASETE